MKRLLLVFVLAMCLSSLAGARDYTLSIGATGQIAASPDFDPLSDSDGLGFAHLEVGIEFDEWLEGFSLELAYQGGGVTSDLFAGDRPWLQTRLSLHGLTLSASYRLPIASWLNAVARLGGTMDFARLQLADDDEVLLSDWSMARVGVMGTLGVEFVLPRNLWRKWFGKPAGDPLEGFTMGFRLEAGWSHRQEFSFDEAGAPGGSSSPGDLDRQGIDLGSIPIHGFLFRAGMVLVF